MNDSVLVNQVYLIFNHPLFLVDSSVNIIDVTNNGGSVRLKQFCHLRLCEPHSIVLHTNIDLRLSVLGLIDEYLVILSHCHIVLYLRRYYIFPNPPSSKKTNLHHPKDDADSVLVRLGRPSLIQPFGTPLEN